MATRKYDLVHLLITNRCNLRCPHCLANSGEADEGELPTKEMIRVVKQLNKIPYKDIHFEGGEPFLREDFYLILDAFKTLDNATIITNGTIPYDKRFEVLKKKRVDGVMFSLDNFGRPKGGQYKGILSNFKAYQEEDLPVKIRTTINRQNIDFMEEICQIANELKVKVIRFGAYKLIGRGAQAELKKKYRLDKRAYQEIFRKLAILFKKYGQDHVIKLSAPACFSHKNDGNQIYKLAMRSPIAEYASLIDCFAYYKQFNIFSNGDVTQCNESATPVVLGNLRSAKLAEILKNETAFKKGHGCNHGHLLICSDKKSYNMQ